MIGKDHKLSDDQLDEIAGGQFKLNNTLFRQGEGTEIKSAVKTVGMNGIGIQKLDTMPEGIGEKDTVGVKKDTSGVSSRQNQVTYG